VPPELELKIIKLLRLHGVGPYFSKTQTSRVFFQWSAIPFSCQLF